MLKPLKGGVLNAYTYKIGTSIDGKESEEDTKNGNEKKNYRHNGPMTTRTGQPQYKNEVKGKKK